jgi:hypothetical protein
MTSIREIEINSSNTDGSTSQWLTGSECSQFGIGVRNTLRSWRRALLSMSMR